MLFSATSLGDQTPTVNWTMASNREAIDSNLPAMMASNLLATRTSLLLATSAYPPGLKKKQTCFPGFHGFAR